MQVAPKVNGHSPWGWIQSVSELTEGMWLVSTAGHGGIKLSRQMNAKMPKQLRREGGWYEEDCEAALVVLGFPEHFTRTQLDDAERSVKNWFPAAYEAYTGTVIPSSESFTKRNQEFAEATKTNWVVVAAWGSWQKGVPAGMVGTLATMGGIRGAGEEKHFLVPEDEYQKRSPFGFIIDPSRHQEVADFTKN
jgi:hypothetical protein